MGDGAGGRCVGTPPQRLDDDTDKGRDASNPDHDLEHGYVDGLDQEASDGDNHDGHGEEKLRAGTGISSRRVRRLWCGGCCEDEIGWIAGMVAFLEGGGEEV
jgi:hypothetical protein